jgi:exodeoxyribonuclease VII large subunit
VPVICSIGHHTDRTLLDDVAAVSCSTPTHAAEAAVPIDCRAARCELPALAARLDAHGRRAVLSRARTLAHLARAPGQQVARHRRQLELLMRELRAGARGRRERARSLFEVHLLGLTRTAARARGSETAGRGRELERMSLALAAHDPARTLARGYALVEDGAEEPVGSAAAARRAGEVRLRFADGAVGARITEPAVPR